MKTAKKLPKAISKSELRRIFGNEVPITVYALHTKFLTKEFVESVLKITEAELKALRVFSFEQTKLIYQFFQIDEQDLV